MPSWVPQVVPDLCPRCGAYWECEHQAGADLFAGFSNVEAKGATLTVEDIRAAAKRLEENSENWTPWIDGSPDAP